MSKEDSRDGQMEKTPEGQVKKTPVEGGAKKIPERVK
jgi:hypothetical protein